MNILDHQFDLACEHCVDSAVDMHVPPIPFERDSIRKGPGGRQRVPVVLREEEPDGDHPCMQRMQQALVLRE
jgi:hypothetical protein